MKALKSELAKKVLKDPEAAHDLKKFLVGKGDTVTLGDKTYEPSLVDENMKKIERVKPFRRKI